jgi:hypothetical protein
MKYLTFFTEGSILVYCYFFREPKTMQLFDSIVVRDFSYGSADSVKKFYSFNRYDLVQDLPSFERILVTFDWSFHSSRVQLRENLRVMAHEISVNRNKFEFAETEEAKKN